MSPIGRVFIVLNLILASVFVWAAGDFLKNQNNWKEKFTEAEAQNSEQVAKLNRQIDGLETERNNIDNAKTTFEQQLAAAKNQIQSLQDDNKRLSELTGDQSANLQKLATVQESFNVSMKAMKDQSEAAYSASIEAGKVKDAAVRAKDVAEAENRQLKNDIVGLNSTIEARNLTIADMQRDIDEKDLLLAVAEQNNFLPQMAAPTLAGTVTNASGRLCTISIADNPGNVDIADQISRRKFRFAIYDDSGYKGEAVVQRYEPTANAVLCRVALTKDDATIRTGDRAATNLP